MKRLTLFLAAALVAASPLGACGGSSSSESTATVSPSVPATTTTPSSTATSATPATSTASPSHTAATPSASPTTAPASPTTTQTTAAPTATPTPPPPTPTSPPATQPPPTATPTEAPPTATPTTASSPLAVAITIGDNYFGPRNASVGVGGTVTWTWTGNAIHDVTGPFGASGLQTRGSFSVTFSSAGTYNYYCSIHQSVGMTATIVVQ